MRSVLILSLLTLVIWFIIMRLEPSNGFIVLDESTIKAMEENVLIQRILWGVMTLLQLFLCYKLYTLIATMTGVYKTGIRIFFGIVICSVIITAIILFIGFSSFWF